MNLWTRGGLGWGQLLRRAWRESWEDEVFGQAARVSFYHFLALFPSLLLLLAMLRAAPGGSALRETMAASFAKILPEEAARLVASSIRELSAGGGVRLPMAVLGAVWAALNGTWAMIVGLNQAYEVEEERPWWRLLLTIAGLTVAFGVLGAAALALISYAGTLHWPVVVACLLAAFALLYRFGPNLYDVELQWSTPGAVFAVVVWLGSSLLLRVWMRHFSSYNHMYGSLAGVAILLLWFYVTGAAILVGGEVNSEIENAAAQSGHPDARHPGERRPGGNRRKRDS